MLGEKTKGATTNSYFFPIRCCVHNIMMYTVMYIEIILFCFITNKNHIIRYHFLRRKSMKTASWAAQSNVRISRNVCPVTLFSLSGGCYSNAIYCRYPPNNCMYGGKKNVHRANTPFTRFENGSFEFVYLPQGGGGKKCYTRIHYIIMLACRIPRKKT